MFTEYKKVGCHIFQTHIRSPSLSVLSPVSYAVIKRESSPKKGINQFSNLFY